MKPDSRRQPPLAVFCLILALSAGAILLATRSAPAEMHRDASLATQQDPVSQMPLAERMSRINDLLRATMRSMADPDQRAETLKSLSDLQGHVHAAKQYPAPGLEQQPDENARQSWSADFRRSLAELLLETARLEMLILEGKADEAGQHIRTTMIRLRDAAHEKFQVD